MTTRPEPLYLDEAAIAARIGMTEAEWRSVSTLWERSGLPRIDPETGKRYMPAVRAWLDRRNGLGDNRAFIRRDGEENHDVARIGRARPATAQA